MSIEQVRMAGGALHGKVVWIERERATLDVHVGGQVPGATRTLHYRRSGGMLCFVGESHTAPQQAIAQPAALPPASDTA
jgi:hypothetical protein